MTLRTTDFHYELPNELIAARPLVSRSASRMMVVHRQSGIVELKKFTDFSTFLQQDDLLVLNDTKVIPARVFSDDGKIEILCLDRLSPLDWRCLVRPGKKMHVGRCLEVNGVIGNVIEIFENGDRLIRWVSAIDLERCGRLALPHYMGREEDVADRERYQTVFAKHEGAIAAPTAGLHFTPELLHSLPHAFLTLHVGVGTFRPVSVEIIKEHVMHSEKYFVSSQTAEKVNSARKIIAVGTTVTRVLESLHVGGSSVRIPPCDAQGATDIFIYPPFDFQVVGGLLTNFHLPQSTLLMLVSAFAGRELVVEAYRKAVESKFRFYSYGDCMLVI